MTGAFIGGKAASIDAAIAEAAQHLAASRLPVIAGLGTDIAGARAAIALARRLGGIVDHMHGDALMRDLDAMREAGMMLTTPTEARVRADLLLLVGPGLIEAWPELPARLNVRDKRIVWLCPSRDEARALGDHKFASLGMEPHALPILLAALRARCGGRPLAPMADAKQLETLARALTEARFGVAVWSAAALDGLCIDMLCGLVKDLNETTRFSGLPLASPDNANAVQLASGWLTGFPLRTGFGRGYAEHDPWRFDAMRMIESGEADCAVWISAYRKVSPPWGRRVPTITIGTNPQDIASEVTISVGRPGIDHDAVDYHADTGTLAAVKAPRAQTISVADTLTRIAAALPAAPPC